jgi:hypothetical protein
MKKLIWGIAATAFSALFCTPALAGPVTYTYTGNAYNQFYADLSCPPDCGISGSFTLSSALGDNFAGGVTPISFSFSDGGITISSSSGNFTGDQFSVTTNGRGAITNWYIELDQSDNVFLSTSNGLDETSYAGASASVSGDPGSWSISGNPTPEPSSLLLLGTGLLGLDPFIRRFAQS